MPVWPTCVLWGPDIAPFGGLNLAVQLMDGLMLKRNTEPVEEEVLLQLLLHEFYQKNRRGRAGTTSLPSQSNFCAQSCHYWDQTGTLANWTLLTPGLGWQHPLATVFLPLTVPILASHCFSTGCCCLPWVGNISQWQKGSFPLFCTRLPVPWQLCAGCLSSQSSWISTAGGAGAASSEFIRPAKIYSQVWKGYCGRTGERVNSGFRIYFLWGIGNGFVSPGMSSKQVSQLCLKSDTDRRQMLLYIFQ